MMDERIPITLEDMQRLVGALMIELDTAKREIMRLRMELQKVHDGDHSKVG
jgi:hypothetical protein